MTLSDLFVWLHQRRRALISLVITGTIFLVGINLFMSYAIISIEITSPSPAQSITIHTVTEKEKKRTQLSGQLAIMSRDTKTLVISGGSNIKTQVAITIPWYGFVAKKVSLKLDKNAEKLAFRSTLTQTCPIYRPMADSLAYYDCTKQNLLIENSDSVSTRWANRALYEIDSKVKPIKPYMGGYISIADTSEGEGPGDVIYIRAVNEEGKITQYETPIGLPKEDLISSRIFTNTYDTKDSRFVIVSRLGDIFIGTPGSGGKVEYQVIAAVKGYDPSYNQTLCRISNESIYCYRGHWRIGDIPEGFDYNKTAASQVMVYSFATNSEKTYKLTRNITMLEDMKVTTKGEVFGNDSRYLYHFVKIGDQYEARRIAVYPAATSAGETLYYVHDNAVYAVDENDPSVAYQVFYSPNIVPKSIYTADGNIFILGSNEKNPETTYAYKLLNESNSGTSKRSIDVLPIYSPGNPDFYFSDFVGDRIYFSLNISRKPTQQQFDEEFSVKKEATINYLRSLEFSVDESKITFGY